VSTLVLTALVKERHDNVDTVCGGCRSADDSLEILIVVIRGHVVYISGHLVGKRMVCYIDHAENIGSADRFVYDPLCFTTSETRAGAVEKIGVNIVATVL